MTKRERLTTDNPNTIDAKILNYAYAKDNRVMLRFAGGEEDVDLCKYVAANVSNTTDCQITAEEVMDGACLECCSEKCPIGCLYFASVQAAELRGRLKNYEDLEETGNILRLPCKIGDKLYEIDLPEYGIIVCEAKRFVLADKNSVIVNVIDGHGKDSEYYFEFEDFGKTVFLSREDAAKALKELENETI